MALTQEEDEPAGDDDRAVGSFAAWMRGRGKLGGQVPRVIKDPALLDSLCAFLERPHCAYASRPGWRLGEMKS
jgi:hypothetical protein